VKIKKFDQFLNEDKVNESEFVDNIKAFVSSYMPKVKDVSQDAINKSKDVIAKAYGFSVEQWNDPENQYKVKSFYKKLKYIFNRITKAGWEVLSDPKKLSTLLTTLKLGTVVSIIKGIWDLIFATSIDFGWFSVNTTIGGIFYFKLAIFLFAIRVVLGVIGGVITLEKVVKNIVGFIRDLIDLFTNNNKNPDQNNKPIQESLVKLFEMYGYAN
jgi:hypothetical protein